MQVFFLSIFIIMNIKQYFTDEVIQIMKKAIKEASGNEVFFTGEMNKDGIIIKVKVGARGKDNTVPVNFTDIRNDKAAVLIHNHPGGNLTPSNADLSVAEFAAENSKGFYIINNQVSEIYVVIEAPRLKEIVPIEIQKAANYIGEGGALSKISDTFEPRQAQIELLKNISESFNKNLIGVFEAGTGVGKSYAYLIPSVLWSLQNNEKVVISTGTINLQQQLCQKDIPAVEKILGKKINFVLMKGRQNYVCKRRLNDASSMLDLFEEDTDEIKKIAEWARVSDTGSKSELTFFPTDNNWSKINSESDACMGIRCPFHNECFVMKVRKEAAGANVIVVNHHLLFADIESRLGGAGFDDAAVLPPYRRIVFDEAHGIENAATSFFSESFQRFKVLKLLNQMYRKKKNSIAGYLSSIAVFSTNEQELDKAYDLQNQIKNSITNLEISAADLIGNEYSKRICNQTKRDFGPFLVIVEELAKNLGAFCELIRSIMDGIDDEDKTIPQYWESKIILRRLDAYVILLKNFTTWDERPENVYWIQKKKLPFEMAKENNPNYIILTETPLDISNLMNSGVFEPMESVICTSATLKTGTNFNYWLTRTGVMYSPKEKIKVNQYDSPFPYDKNMLFAVPKDAPFPEKMEYQQYIEMAIPRLILAANGRTLVLFTSYESLRSAHKAAQAVLKGFSGRIMKQGDDDNSKLLDAFRDEKESVLFATDSYWQGVDIPGESLSQVIIVKLPFSVPSDPVYMAKSEAITSRGGSSFFELSVPEAVIKFRQGIGRLIRKSDDRGAVVVLDRRIFEKNYGSIFTASLGDCKKIYEPLDEITKAINNFIFN